MSAGCRCSISKAAACKGRQGEESPEWLADGTGSVRGLLSSSGGGKMARVRDNKPFFNEEWFLFEAGGGLPSSLRQTETDVEPESGRTLWTPVTNECQGCLSHTLPHQSLDEIVWSRICAPADERGGAADRTEVAI
jgi:hypothetical protein